jgi:hypothetical protein
VLNNVQNCDIQACLPPLDDQDMILISGDHNKNIRLPGSLETQPQT